MDSADGEAASASQPFPPQLLSGLVDPEEQRRSARLPGPRRVMWRGKSENRPPLQELILQPNVIPSSEKVTLACSMTNPMLYQPGPQPEDSIIPSLLEFPQTTWPDFPPELPHVPMKELEASQDDPREQCLGLVPQTSSTPKASEGAAAPLDDGVVKTLTLVPSPSQERPSRGLQSDVPLKMDVGAKAKANHIFVSLSPCQSDAVTVRVAPCPKGNPVDVVTASLGRATSQNASSHPHSEQQQHPEENSVGIRTEADPEASVPLISNSVLPSPLQQFPTSSASGVSPPAGLSDPGTGSTSLTTPEGEELTSSPSSEEGQLAERLSLPAQIPAETGPQVAVVATVGDLNNPHSPRTGSWMSPLAWLEKGVNTSAVLDSLRQSFPLPALKSDRGTSTSPVSSGSVASWLVEKSTNTSQVGQADTKDNASETDSLLWCRPPDLSALSRRDLEDHLLSSLIVLEALSRQLRDWQKSGATPHPEAQDSSTQTDVCPSGVADGPQHLQKSQETHQHLVQAHNAMQSWGVESQELLSLLNQCLLKLREDRTAVEQEHQQAEALVSRCGEVLARARTKLQSHLEEREESRSREERALRGRAAAETVLEAFCVHCSQRISELQHDLESQAELCGLLRETQGQQASLHLEQKEVAQQAAQLASTLREDWLTMHREYTVWTAVLDQAQKLMEPLLTKSQKALQERDEAREKEEEVSWQLDQVSAQLKDSQARIEQLELENRRLAADLQLQLQSLASTQSHLEKLQDQYDRCARDLASRDQALIELMSSREEQAAWWQEAEATLKSTQLEQRAALAEEARELQETVEFLDQENQVAHTELTRLESQLRSTLAALQERIDQCQHLKDSVDSLEARLADATAEAQELKKRHQSSPELSVLSESLRNLLLSLQTALKEGTPLSAARTPARHLHPSDNSFLGSVLRAMEGELEPDLSPLLRSDTSAFSQVESKISLWPAGVPHTEKSLEELTCLMQEAQSLCCQLQDSKEKAVGALQQEISTLQIKLQAQEEQHQEALKNQEAEVEKLSRALCMRYKNEKELQEVIRQQEEKILEQIDKIGEFTSLREEVTQLTRSLQRSETEAKVLQEALACQQNPDSQPMDTAWIQEKVWLCQEVDKLRLLLLDMEKEKAALVVKSQSHRNILEENLRCSEKELEKLDDIFEQIYKALSNIPEVVSGCQELQKVMQLLR
ncbi:LOW QUALITY PROTEIN: sperm-associated antigen 5 [Dromiciops gliroides]|uniref:LOW QUALITY PROTEIN: sperm-associated antigen 5 n=1 Tax=Dromiciops gliroides TaxID=33562 RepID=UPI001CC3D246|nr:LOW QUALITY PROTEIN: sperm-associated antigen 5 [Dromiciops gliroides]